MDDPDPAIITEHLGLNEQSMLICVYIFFFFQILQSNFILIYNYSIFIETIVFGEFFKGQWSNTVLAIIKIWNSNTNHWKFHPGLSLFG